MDIEYFLKYLTFSQANLYVKGLNNRIRNPWEVERMHINALSKMLCGQSAGLPLPWDDETSDAERPKMTAADIERLKKVAADREKQLNNK